MSVHDWTRVEPGIFHHFHNEWMTSICNALNEGLLPEGFYALIEQHAGGYIADVLTLQHDAGYSPPPASGAMAVAQAPPRVRRRLTASAAARQRRKTVTIRHVTGHRIVALLEAVSPANKDRARNVSDFAAKVEDAVKQGVHVLMLDLLPPGPHDPQGMHGAIWERLAEDAPAYDLPAAEPLTLASYVAEAVPTAYVEHLAVGGVLPNMPLFFDPANYINVPLETTYESAYEKVPAFWRKVVEGIS